MGFILTSVEEASNLIFFNHSPKAYKSFKKRGGELQKTVLIRTEPEAVLPSQFTQRIERLYGLVITPGSTRSKSPNETCWPYKYHLNPSTPDSGVSIHDLVRSSDFGNRYDFQKWMLRKNKFVLIAANKVSPTANSNYQFRRDVARRLSKDEIDVFGGLWNAPLGVKIRERLGVLKNAISHGIVPNFFTIWAGLLVKYSTAEGPVPDKHLAAQQYKFALVIENSNNYVSEKLIDSILDGCITFYVGPDPDVAGIPNGTVIRIGTEINVLREILANPESLDIAGMLLAMKNFVFSDEFRAKWDEDSVFKKIAINISTCWNLM